MNNPIFIVGIPRSGSTLLLNVLTRNPNIFRIPEIHFLNPWRKDFKYFIRHSVGDLSNEDNIRHMIELLFSRKPIPGITGIFWLKDIKKLDSPKFRSKLFYRIVNSDRSLANIFKSIIDEVTKISGFDRCCVKFPVYVNHVPDLLKWYSDCKIIHVTRDSRAIAISRTNDPGGAKKIINKYQFFAPVIKKTMMAFVMLQYIWTAKLHMRFCNHRNYYVLRYEDLLKNPEHSIRNMCDFLSLEFSTEMLKSKEGEYAQQSSITGKQITDFDPDAAYRWKSVIKNFDNLILTQLTQNSMQKFGY